MASFASSVPIFVLALRASGLDLRAATVQFRRTWLIQVMEAHRGIQCRAANELGIHRNTLADWLTELDIPPDTGRNPSPRRKRPCSDHGPGKTTRYQRALVNSQQERKTRIPETGAPAAGCQRLGFAAGASDTSPDTPKGKTT